MGFSFKSGVICNLSNTLQQPHQPELPAVHHINIIGPYHDEERGTMGSEKALLDQ